MKRFLCYLLCITMLMTLSPTSFAEDAPQYQSLGDPAVQQILTDELYASLIDNLPGEDYAVTDIQTVYISQEYLDELAFNSQSNIFFGYTLAELDEQFTGTRYVFTVGDAGETIAQPFEAFQDDTLQQVIRNVAIGTGVILVCVTVSSLTVTAAPAISMIFTVAGEYAKIIGAKGAITGFISGAVTVFLQKGDLEDFVKTCALSSSEGFKWGSILGALNGGAYEYGLLRKYLKELNPSSLLTLNDIAIIQRESKYPLEYIYYLHSMDEYQVYKEAGLVPKAYKNRLILEQPIDYFAVNKDGITNLDLMRKGNAPLDSNGNSYELHHIGAEMKSPLAILTKEQHDSKGLHWKTLSEVDRKKFGRERKEFWKYMANLFDESLIIN